MASTTLETQRGLPKKAELELHFKRSVEVFWLEKGRSSFHFDGRTCPPCKDIRHETAWPIAGNSNHQIIRYEVMSAGDGTREVCQCLDFEPNLVPSPFYTFHSYHIWKMKTHMAHQSKMLKFLVTGNTPGLTLIYELQINLLQYTIGAHVLGSSTMDNGVSLKIFKLGNNIIIFACQIIAWKIDQYKE